jgi:hypothetical protein
MSSMQNYKIIELAYLVQKRYENRYGKKIAISKNNNDLNIYKNITVSNHKLQSILDMEVGNKLSIEIDKLFGLLEENCNGK